MDSEILADFFRRFMPGEEGEPQLAEYRQAYADTFSAGELTLYVQAAACKGPFTREQLRDKADGTNFAADFAACLDKYILRRHDHGQETVEYLACTKQEVHGAYLRDSVTSRRFSGSVLTRVIGEYVLGAVNVGAGGVKIPTPQHLKPYKVMLDPGQAKKIVLGAEIPDRRRVETTNDVIALIRQQSSFSLSPCSCRIASAAQADHHCLEEGQCLFFNEIARHYTALGQGREITVEEAIDYVQACGKKGLVHMTENVNSRAYVLCNCCPCCCMTMKSVQRGEIHSVMPSKYQPVFLPDRCVACGRCVPMCPGRALSLSEKELRFEGEKCIGCGNCAALCKKSAVRLTFRSDQGELESKFDDYEQLNQAAAGEQSQS